MYALASFSFTDLSSFQFSSSLGTTTTISASASFPLYVSFQYLSIVGMACPGSHPYYMSTESRCYDSCPAYSVTDGSLCKICGTS